MFFDKRSMWKCCFGTRYWYTFFERSLSLEATFLSSWRSRVSFSWFLLTAVETWNHVLNSLLPKNYYFKNSCKLHPFEGLKFLDILVCWDIGFKSPNVQAVNKANFPGFLLCEQNLAALEVAGTAILNPHFRKHVEKLVNPTSRHLNRLALLETSLVKLKSFAVQFITKFQLQCPWLPLATSKACFGEALQARTAVNGGLRGLLTHGFSGQELVDVALVGFLLVLILLQ